MARLRDEHCSHCHCQTCAMCVGAGDRRPPPDGAAAADGLAVWAGEYRDPAGLKITIGVAPGGGALVASSTKWRNVPGEVDESGAVSMFGLEGR